MELFNRTEEGQLLLQARQASVSLAHTSPRRREAVLQILIEQLRLHQDQILEANTLDLETSRELAVPGVVLNWLKLTPERLQLVFPVLEKLITANLATSTEGQGMSGYGHVYSVVYPVPVGVVALIYEALPELALILAGMCIKTGNALVLRGGTETSHTNKAIAQLLEQTCQQANLPTGSFQTIAPTAGNSMQSLVSQPNALDLVIPYGRPTLVQQVIRNATVPMVHTSIGNGYLFWANSGAGDLVRSMILDSHRGQPEAVNAIEKVLITPTLQRPLLNLLWDKLTEEGFEIRGDQELCSEYSELLPVNPEEWGTPYLRKIVAFKVVQDLQEGITWMNTYSSHHANCIVTDSYKESRIFVQDVKSSGVFINTSPQFSRLTSGPGNTVALGMAALGGASHGVISLNTLLTRKSIFQSDGQNLPTST
jgi:glutamate-5-semialdehyde dehydrogenase